MKSDRIRTILLIGLSTLLVDYCQSTIGLGKVRDYSVVSAKIVTVKKTEKVKITGRVVEPTGLKIRERPGQSYKQIGTIPLDGEVNIFDITTGPQETLYGIRARWYQVEYEGKNGWAFGGYISYKEEVEKKEVYSNTNEEVNEKLGLKFREAPSGKEIGFIPFGKDIEVLDDTKGESLTLYDIKSRWLQVSYDEKTGWVFGGMVDYKKKEEIKEKEIIAQDKKPKEVPLSLTVQSGNLEWKKCSEGQNNDATCSGDAKIYKWMDAVKACSFLNTDKGFEKKKGWRIPKKEELLTLRVCSKGLANSDSCVEDLKKPTINNELFPNTPANNYWTSSTEATDMSAVWVVDFALGKLTYDSTILAHNLRCVRRM
jgi:uncharacterized protein YraI